LSKRFLVAVENYEKTKTERDFYGVLVWGGNMEKVMGKTRQTIDLGVRAM
jgi:hypothetical protein